MLPGTHYNVIYSLMLPPCGPCSDWFRSSSASFAHPCFLFPFPFLCLLPYLLFTLLLAVVIKPCPDVCISYSQWGVCIRYSQWGVCTRYSQWRCLHPLQPMGMFAPDTANGDVCTRYSQWGCLHPLQLMGMFAPATANGDVCTRYSQWGCLHLLQPMGMFAPTTANGDVCTRYSQWGTCPAGLHARHRHGWPIETMRRTGVPHEPPLCTT